MFSQRVLGPSLGPDCPGRSPIWSVHSELRFLEWAIDHLVAEERCTLIVPDGILFRSDGNYLHVRRRLLTDCIVRAVVRLPVGIFSEAGGIRVSLLIFEMGTAQQGTIRYYEVPSLTTGQVTRRALPADLLDSAIAWVLGGERDRYSWEVDLQSVRQGEWSLDLRLPGAYAVSDYSDRHGQLPLFADVPDFDYDTVTLLAPWIKERGKRAFHTTVERLLGVSKSGITPFKGKAPANTHRYRRVEAGDFVYNPMRAELGSIALCRDAKQEGWASPDYVVFRLAANAPFDSTHLLRFLKSQDGRLVIGRLSCGSVRRRLRYADLCRITVPYGARGNERMPPAE